MCGVFAFAMMKQQRAMMEEQHKRQRQAERQVQRQLADKSRNESSDKSSNKSVSDKSCDKGSDKSSDKGSNTSSNKSSDKSSDKAATKAAARSMIRIAIIRYKSSSSSSSKRSNCWTNIHERRSRETPVDPGVPPQSPSSSSDSDISLESSWSSSSSSSPSASSWSSASSAPPRNHYFSPGWVWNIKSGCAKLRQLDSLDRWILNSVGWILNLVRSSNLVGSSILLNSGRWILNSSIGSSNFQLQEHLDPQFRIPGQYPQWKCNWLTASCVALSRAFSWKGIKNNGP